MTDSRSQGHASIEPVDTLTVLVEEYKRIWPGRPAPESLAAYHEAVQEHGQAALCLSGGGIRSASFALGVMQALSRKGLLTRFHYLSSVSGGGYINGWLQRWMHDKGAAEVDEALRLSCDEVAQQSGERAAPILSGLAPEEPPQIQALRRNSNFITPRVGLGSNDTWTAISISMRNIAVNWLLFAPLFVLVAMIPNVFANVTDWVRIGALQHSGFIYLPFALALVCAAVSGWHTCRALPSYRGRDFKPAGAGDGWLLGRIVKWLIGWALFGTMVLWPYVSTELTLDDMLGRKAQLPTLPSFDDWRWIFSTFGFTLVSFVVGLLSLIVAGMSSPRGKTYRDAFAGDIPVWFVAFFLAALTVPIGCWLFELLPVPDINQWQLYLFATLMPFWLLGAQLMIAFVFAAFRRDRPAPVDADGDREWLARLSAVKIKNMILWAVLAFTSLLLFPSVRDFFSTTDLSLSGLLAAVSGSTAVLGGKATQSGHTTRPDASALLRYLPMQQIVMIATFVFAITLLTLFAAVEQSLSGWLGGLLQPLIDASGARLVEAHWLSGPKWIDKLVAAHLLIGLVLGTVLWWFSRRIPVNRFSLQGLYRNRLCRAFLGGAREHRDPDRFTGFDPDDNIGLDALMPVEKRRDEAAGAAAPVILYPVINVALNVTATENLAWQERKAESFILTPLYCGSAALLPEPALSVQAPFSARGAEGEERAAPGVYLPSSVYAGSEPELIQMYRGISLATAISISGAAASPNMGYHSSPATAFLMTLFNVRLGAWLPNPARAASLGNKVFLSNPSNSLRALLRELGGSTDDLGADIYLSDGGHFENLAVYEMIRRRCPFILVSDAGADPNCDFADLGNLVRKAKIDLGADIAFGQMRISSRAKPIDAQIAWALGTISYGDGQCGRILYIKPSFFGRDLPLDVVSYAAASATFPHETTADQFFSESQFESYRKLGFTLTREIGGDRPFDSLAEFFETVNGTADEEEDGDRKLKSRFLAWLRGFAQAEPSASSA